MSLEQIKSELQKHKEELSKKYNISRLAIFGSYARREETSISDIDIMVDFDKPIGIEFIDLADELEQILKHRVDLVSKKAIKPKYYSTIEKDLLYV